MKPMRRRVAKLSLIFVATITVFGLIASWVVGGMLVAPSPRSAGDLPTGLNAKSISLTSLSGATIAGWHTRPTESNGVVVLVHGIHSSRTSMLGRAQLLHKHGFATVMIDLQAHGESSGEQITLGHLEQHDVRAAVDFARQAHPDERIGLIGVSLGGATAVLASPLNIDAMIIESVFPDIDAAIENRVAARLGPLSAIPSQLLLLQIEPRLGVSREELRPMEKVSQVAAPILVMSGCVDQYTTETETKSIFNVALEPKQLCLIDGAGHENLHKSNRKLYESTVLAFLRKTLRDQSIVEPPTHLIDRGI